VSAIAESLTQAQVFKFSSREELKYRFLYWINAYPAIFMPLARMRHPRATDLLVDRNTDLVIEGFGRAGSTFANFAFLSAQTRPVKTVHHTHASAQVLVAVRKKIPTLVIVRKPEDSALSHMVRHNVTARAALMAWIRFHRRIMPFREQIVIAKFEQVLKDFGTVICQINEKFDKHFDVWQHTKENEADVFEQVRRRNRHLFGEAITPERLRSLALPTPGRDALKAQLRTQLQCQEVAPLCGQAEEIYSAIIG